MTSNVKVSVHRLLWPMVLVAVVGCSRPVGPVAGVVKFSDGSPVTSGSIEFRRDSDEKRFASRITPNGTFRPADKDGKIGLSPGTYDVVVVQIVLTEDLVKEAHTHGHTVPRRYADYYTSDLSVDIADGQLEPFEISIELEDGDIANN